MNYIKLSNTCKAIDNRPTAERMNEVNWITICVANLNCKCTCNSRPCKTYQITLVGEMTSKPKWKAKRLVKISVEKIYYMSARHNWSFYLMVLRQPPKRPWVKCQSRNVQGCAFIPSLSTRACSGLFFDRHSAPWHLADCQSTSNTLKEKYHHRKWRLEIEDRIYTSDFTMMRNFALSPKTNQMTKSVWCFLAVELRRNKTKTHSTMERVNEP
jgi:hypothetical protein